MTEADKTPIIAGATTTTGPVMIALKHQSSCFDSKLDHLMMLAVLAHQNDLSGDNILSLLLCLV